MLIRWATHDDLPAWQTIEREVAPLFIIPCITTEDEKVKMIKKHEFLTAVDYMSGENMGLYCCGDGIIRCVP